MLFRRILLAALLCGLLSGGLLGVMQLYTTLPLILAAERLENSAATAQPENQQQPLQSSLKRNLLSMAATTIIACAYAMILLSLMRLSGRTAICYSAWWGLSGYLVFFLMPALGLPPSLPGVQYASLEFNRLWWLASSVSTAAALCMLFFARHWFKLGGILLLLLPFALRLNNPLLIHYDSASSEVIAELEWLQPQFIFASAASLALFWMLLSLFSSLACSYYLDKFPVKGAADSSG